MFRYRKMKVLSALNKMRLSRKPFSETELYNRAKIYEPDKMVKLCQSLEEDGYLDKLKITNTNEITSIELSYLGMTYRHEFVIAILKGVWIWFTNNLVGLAALIASVVSLLRTL